MDEFWDFYECRVNDKRASISLNLNACTPENQRQKPLLHWFFFYLLNPREDGLNKNEESKILYAIEDEIVAAAKNSSAIQFVGRIANDGRREMYFYGPPGSSIKSSTDTAMWRFPGYRWEIGSQMDMHWRQYRDVLYPSPQGMETMRNRAVLMHLQKSGDTLEELREVAHWAYFEKDENAQSFADAIGPLGYKIIALEHAKTPNSPQKIMVHFSRIDSVQQADIDHATLELRTLAKKLDGNYDGWETQVMAKNESRNSPAKLFLLAM